ncbi:MULTISPECIES: NUDIX hydrolase [Streptomyces]|uniref:NUDIX domain-containing protein n=1 Tax=Streptomyces doudnae TaxID=3075536 RepID=A0ABD5ENX8_9ACTN|nr:MULTISPECIES: NUDIX domain-containing protein [unclassified Streptomyces]MDT0436005.1 NUDIX domain-containing protein [Streptomyces sp. DSM 41981]SCD81273.1 ADP-ribose pyrophosphatase YjhB, NUDIX family [Streptomyces sp. SolWspMP-5a-2]
MESDLAVPLHAVSVTGVVLKDDGRLLAIKRADDGTWVPPGGLLERDEEVEQGVVREVFEETGVTVRPVRLTGVYKNVSLRTITIALLCHVEAGEPRVSDEAVDVRWLTQKEAELMMPPLRALRVRDALDSNGPFVRSY